MSLGMHPSRNRRRRLGVGLLGLGLLVLAWALWGSPRTDPAGGPLADAAPQPAPGSPQGPMLAVTPRAAPPPAKAARASRGAVDELQRMLQCAWSVAFRLERPEGQGARGTGARA